MNCNRYSHIHTSIELKCNKNLLQINKCFCVQELKASDDRYVKDLKRQARDVDLMIERMQEQISGLMKSYREELDLIEVCSETVY